MLRHLALPFILILLTSPIFAQSPLKEEKYDLPMNVDSPAKYPGGMPALYRYLKSIMEYPQDAQQQAIEGKTFVEFIVNGAGYIIPNSVRTIKKLHPSCDAEAVRVIKACNSQWKPALKNGKGVNQRFVLPVAFSLKEDTNPADPLYPIEFPIKTVVEDNTFQAQDSTLWPLFGNARLTIESGFVSKGDSVFVTGWAPYAYFIETKNSKGYVSWKSLKVTDELKQLSTIVDVQSTIMDEQNKKIDDFSRGLKVDAHLSMSANKKSVFAGECVTITLAFNVHEYNRAPLQFYELAEQIVEMMPDLILDNCWIINSGLSDVTAETKVITGENYVSYPFYKASYCPVNTGTMVIPAQKLRMAKLKAGSRDIDSILTFTSKPLSIKVDELPDGVARMGKDGYRIVGKFTLSDSLLSTDIHAGDIVTYTLTVGGEGLTFPMDPPVMNASGIRSQLQDIIDSDTLIHDQLQCTKTFVYQVVFDSAGVYDFSRNIGFTYFNEVTEKLETLKSSRRVRAADVATTSYVELVKTFGSKNNFIAVDASTSMAIKDYMPHRLGAVKGALKEFLMSRDVCDIGLILFGSDAKHFALPTPDKCYTRRFLDSIDFNLNTRGTAIGDAIWLAKNSFAKNKLHKKLVIIGDGDNTAGRIPPLFAATLAKKYNITIYTIGVGTRGLVPYGRDETGKPFMIENTFTDGDFKTISSITNGRYYWAKDEKEVQRILKMIFP